jgi:hypothetical protein
MAGPLVVGCADANKYTIGRAERRWSESVGRFQKGNTVLDWERSVQQGKTRAEGGSVFTTWDKSFSESTRATNRELSISSAAHRISGDESHQRYLSDNSVAGASRRLDQAQGR